ncbi:MAG: DUF1330 domain-containing protein [Deinococcus-Thermus bacterium]|jgi:uncharacterized protein (DUF1330 family)|nr:DUF1330 domain-containing protein [Deinococcota bacterium]
MPVAYLIAQVRVDDPEGYKQYTARTPALVAEWGGEFIVRGGAKEVVEGPPTLGDRIVVIRFPSMQRALDFYHSDAYAEVKAIRQAHSEAQFVVVEGVGEA